MGFMDLLQLSRLKILALAQRIMCFSITLSPPSVMGGAQTSHLKQNNKMKAPIAPDVLNYLCQMLVLPFFSNAQRICFCFFPLTTQSESHPKPSSLLSFFFSFLTEPRMLWPNQSISEGQRFAWEQKPPVNTHPHHPFPTQDVQDTVNQCGRGPDQKARTE